MLNKAERRKRRVKGRDKGCKGKREEREEERENSNYGFLYQVPTADLAESYQSQEFRTPSGTSRQAAYPNTWMSIQGLPPPQKLD